MADAARADWHRLDYDTDKVPGVGSERAIRELLATRVTAPAIIERLQVYLTRDPQPSKLLFEIALTGEPTGSGYRGAASGTSTSRV